MEDSVVAEASALSAEQPLSQATSTLAPGLGVREVLLLLSGTLGAAIAYLVPMVFTLALKLDRLDPGNEAVLGYIIGAGSLVTLVTAPLTGILSDRTRSRWGRRRPFTVAGLVIGLIAVWVMSSAPSVVVLGMGWALANVGWGTALGSIGNIQADRLKPSQRGRVGALAGVITQVAPVAGILLVGPFSSDIVMALWVPAIIGSPLIVAFILFVHEDDSRSALFTEPLTMRSVIRSYGFRPREFPDFAWNWLGRFLFFSGITFTSTYSTFFLAARMDTPVSEVAPLVALMSGITTAVSAVGAIASGWFSDRWGRRRPFICGSVVVFAIGASASAFARDLPMLIVGGVLSSLGVAVFLAVNQAMVLDVLPMRETQAGRFMGITAFSQKIPSALAPLVAPLLLVSGTAGPGGNFTLLYLVAGLLVLSGGLLIGWRVRSVR
ncbi:MFS transporter [Microbacterium sp. kSW2-24]|uniref:MFS transporter n=1 Tax=Microbacterium galbinum TaxID=2851646 RepID=UPI001FFC845E|nr:MFS transporter [Microbacterium galbinum]MCK2022695.1 MFS transporter [Microbacterium galbinum]